jgi:uncharacterized protein
MKLQPDRFDFPAITGYGPGWVAVLGVKTGQSLVVCSDGTRQDWPVASFEQLQSAHFEQLAQLPVEVVILGTGSRIRFVAPALQKSLIHAKIGMETMDTGAACRTFNILAGEGRKVALAVLIEP